MKKEDLIACVLGAHGTLVRERDLSPANPKVNEALSALVGGVMEGCPPGDADAVLADPRVRAIRGDLLERLALAEGEMERHWARAFCARTRLAAGDLGDFLYWDCYRHLVGAELRNLPLRRRLRNEESVAFVGAGPLPLSAILVQAWTGIKVTCIDRDPEACRLACELCRKAGIAGVEVECAGGGAYDYARSPVVLIASLVPEKRAAMRRVRETCPHALVALRSTDGLRTLLYEPVKEAELAAMGCGYLGQTCDNPAAINTTLFYEAAPALPKDGHSQGPVTGSPAESHGSSCQAADPASDSPERQRCRCRTLRVSPLQCSR